MVRERVLRLSRQSDPVNEEQHPSDGAGLEEPLDERGGGSRLAGAGRHLHQQVAPSAGDFRAQLVDAIYLVVAVHDAPVGFDAGKVATNTPGGDLSLQIVLRIEARDLPRMRVGLAVEKQHVLAVREEDERHFELLGVVAPLILRGYRIGARPLGFQRRHGTPLAVAEGVVRLRTVGEHVLEHDA